MNRDIKGNTNVKITELSSTPPLDKQISYKLLSISYLTPSWGMLFWLNFSTEPNLFGHLIAIPSLFLMTGYSAYLIARKGG
ncbi:MULTISPECIES: hypothetical protein [unclassified Shewanella]|uniref:hypothetical protein n=1 Tax=unclassified Shewanella TaxID=196818 RepID=UPI001BC65C3C|nr:MULTISPECIES: hypothetical protein [unclassified Shewanella]GIU14087.1 hypothetical protein TUM4444_23350 [Shewanella sp. MBTL60-112-B1]GIU29922.1 hypothetical protein TUM4445_12720 [Shewanella sp. MBTL60-112-B2]